MTVLRPSLSPGQTPRLCKHTHFLMDSLTLQVYLNASSFCFPLSLVSGVQTQLLQINTSSVFIFKLKLVICVSSKLSPLIKISKKPYTTNLLLEVQRLLLSFLCPSSLNGKICNLFSGSVHTVNSPSSDDFMVLAVSAYVEL